MRNGTDSTTIPTTLGLWFRIRGLLYGCFMLFQGFWKPTWVNMSSIGILQAHHRLAYELSGLWLGLQCIGVQRFTDLGLTIQAVVEGSSIELGELGLG